MGVQDVLGYIAIELFGALGVLAIGYWFYNKIVKSRQLSIAHILQSEGTGYGVSSDLGTTTADLELIAKAFYTNLNKTYGVVQKSSNVNCSKYLLMLELREQFNEIECIMPREINDNQRIDFYKATIIRGAQTASTAFIGIWSSKVNATYYDSSGRTHNEFTRKAIDGSNTFWKTSDIVIFYPEGNEESVKVEMLKECIEYSRVKETIPPSPTARVYELVKSKWGGYSLKPLSIANRPWSLLPLELEQNYPTMTVGIYNERYRIPSDKLEGLILSIISKEKTSVAFYGPPGTGKTRLMLNYMQRLSAIMEDTIFILANKDVVTTLCKAGEDISSLLFPGKNHVLVLDEADDMVGDKPSLFKTFTDGIMHHTYNLSLMYSANNERDNPILRNGRVVIFDVPKMSKRDADLIAARLDAAEDESKVFQIEHYINWINNFKDNEVTLDQVYAFYKDKGILKLETDIKQTVVTAGKIVGGPAQPSASSDKVSGVPTAAPTGNNSNTNSGKRKRN